MADLDLLLEIDKDLLLKSMLAGCVLGMGGMFYLPILLGGLGTLILVLAPVMVYEQLIGTEKFKALLLQHPLILRCLVITPTTMISAVMVGSFAQLINLFVYQLPGRYMNWVALGILPLGYLAHVFKMRGQFYYGLSEVLVGVATGFGLTLRNEFRSTQALGLIGATYVIARGFNNIREAQLKRETKPPGVASHASGT